MNANGSAVTNLTNAASMDRYPVWSPDGKYIAFETNRDGNLEIYVMKADGTQVMKLTNDPAQDTSPSWAP